MSVTGVRQCTITISQGTCTTGPNFTCALGTVASGSNRSEEHTSALQSQSNVVCSLMLENSSSTTDPETGNNTASDTDTVTTSANLSITKTDGETAVTAGDGATHTYTITVSNAGPSFFFNDTATTEIYTLSLHDALPISQGTCTTGPNFTCALGTVASGSN